MPYSLDPRQRKIEIERDIAGLNRKIQHANACYDSLNRFKNTVETSQGDFNFINGKAGQILEPLEAIDRNNPIAKKYRCGMNSSLSSIGMSVVGAAFSGLLGMIAVEKGLYYLQAVQLDGDITLLQGLLSEAEGEIRMLDKVTGG